MHGYRIAKSTILETKGIFILITRQDKSLRSGNFLGKNLDSLEQPVEQRGFKNFMVAWHLSGMG